VQLVDNKHPDKSLYLSNLSLSQLSRRFDCLGELPDLEDSISNLRVAVELTDDVHKPEYLSRLLQTRFERLGQLLSDLDDSISYSQKAVELIDEEHPKKLEEDKAEGVDQAIRKVS
jgi:hypothetical protein